MKQTLRNLINSRIPSLLELKSGCHVNYYWDSFRGEEMISLVVVYETDDFIVFHNTDKNIESPEYRICMHEKNGDEKESYEILGTPPSWGEYLRCLGEDYAIDGGGNIWKYVKEYKAWLSHSFEDATEFPVVDLTKSVLEQSDEIQEQLVDLISNK